MIRCVPSHVFAGVAGAILFSASALASAADTGTTLNDQQSVAVTIYNRDLALVKDTRRVTLPVGDSQLSFRGVSARLRPETAILRSLTSDAKFSILEQNFDFDLLTPAKLLDKYVGSSVQIARMNPATGKETIEEAEVLSTNDGVVVRIGDRIETNPTGRYIFSRLPANLKDQPTLSVRLDQDNGAEQDIELSYLTSGLGWKADYVAELSADETSLELVGWVTLDNKSGTSYTNATLQLVAGDVNQVRDPEIAMRDPRIMRKDMEVAMAAAPMQEESLFEYHLYTLARPTTIADKQTKQVSLLSASGVKTEKVLLLTGNDYYYTSSVGQIGQKIKLGVYVNFKNEEANDLGVALPKGIVRVYKRDSAGRAQFVGEDRIDHTPNLQPVRLKLGDAFDVTANKVQTNFKRIRDGVFETTVRVDVSNAKKESVAVVVREPMPGTWKILDESSAHAKVAAGTAEWKLVVPAEQTETLEYTVRVKF